MTMQTRRLLIALSLIFAVCGATTLPIPAHAAPYSSRAEADESLTPPNFNLRPLSDERGELLRVLITTYPAKDALDWTCASFRPAQNSAVIVEVGRARGAGPYAPRRGRKVIWTALTKTPRNPYPPQTTHA